MIPGEQLFNSKGPRNDGDYGIKSVCECGKINRYSPFQKMELSFTLLTSFQGWARLSNSFQRTQ